MTGDANPTPNDPAEPEKQTAASSAPDLPAGQRPAAIRTPKLPSAPPANTIKPPATRAPTAPPISAPKPAIASEPEKTPGAAPQPAAARPCALVVDDEPANLDFLVRLLEQAKLEVHGAKTGAEALKIAEDHEAMAMVVIDNKLPDTDGVDLLIKMRQRYPKARMVMATMLDERALMTRAFEAGCNVFMVKPHGFMELFRRIVQSGTESEELNRMIIDQYGPRPYRG